MLDENVCRLQTNFFSVACITVVSFQNAYTSLIWAAEEGHESIVIELIAARANVDAQCKVSWKQ